MKSLENFSVAPSPEDLLRARNQLQIEAMQFFHETEGGWVDGGNAKLAASIFEEEPKLLERYFLFQNNPKKLADVINEFEKLLMDHGVTFH